jgi:glycosyltransferase involved in cell wall biosynthesis
MKIIQSDKDSVDVTLLVTFHSEGIFAHLTLNSIERCRKYAEEAGISTEYVWVLDSIDYETEAVLLAHPAYSENTRVIYVDCLDAGASRNAGIAISRGKAIAILDGDDYFSSNWIERAWYSLKEYGDNVILHPEIGINFGTESLYYWQVDPSGQHYDINGLLMSNYWTSWTFAARSVYESCPYRPTRPAETGFGYEDWHWNCETIATGFQHRIVVGTIGFYRRKKISRLSLETSMNGIIPPSRLFDKKYLMEVTE